MPRVMTSAMATAIVAGEIFPAIFFSATFATGPVYVWTGSGSIVWNGHTWIGIGTLGKISTIEEGTDVQARGVTVSLSGIDPTWLSDVLSEFKLGDPVTIWLGLFGGSPLALLADPIVSFSGRIDKPSIDVDGQSAVISINLENRLLDMNVSVAFRYTNQQQQYDYPGDRGMEFVAGLQLRTIYFGANPNSTNNL